jgi:formylglycine-generating enzyme required for sulfatase activity
VRGTTVAPFPIDMPLLNEQTTTMPRAREAVGARPRDVTDEMVWIAGGTFRMGSDNHYVEEAPAHDVKVDGFYIERHPVTNAQFEQFVHATSYVTLAERPANPDDYPGAEVELLEPASVVFQPTSGPVDMRNPYNWWKYVSGANWRHPYGPDSSLDGLSQHPVVHVAYEDVVAYLRWADKTLPSEAEWELAARGGLAGAEYVWGDAFTPDGVFMANTWQGDFPSSNSLEDGYAATSPVGSFPPNGFGLYDMVGNVWEWTNDWYQAHARNSSACCETRNPRGGAADSSYDPRTPHVRIPRKVIKGGSFLCAPSYCRRYRPAARMAQPVDTSACHVGFRCVVRPAA